MGSICCVYRPEPARNHPTEEKDRDKLSEQQAIENRHSHSEEEVAVLAPEKPKETVSNHLEQSLRLLLSTEHRQSPLSATANGPMITWKTTEGCFQLSNCLRKSVSRKALSFLQSHGAFRTLYDMLEEEDSEKVYWALVALESVLVVTDAHALDFGETTAINNQLFTENTLWPLLVHSDDFIKVKALQLLINLNAPCDSKALCQQIAAGLSSFRSPRLMKKNVKIFVEFVGLRSVQSPQLVDAMAGILEVILKQTLREASSADVQTAEMLYQLQNLKYLVELRLHQDQHPPVPDGDYVIEFKTKLKTLSRSDQLILIDDLHPATRKGNRADLYPISCCGTLAVIALIQSLQTEKGIPQDLVNNPQLFAKVMTNLQSSLPDLRQYTLILLSYIYYDPMDCPLEEDSKEALLDQIASFLSSGAEELRYLSGCLVRNLYLGSLHFVINHRQVLKQIAWSLLAFSKAKYFVYTVQNVLELVIDEYMAIYPEGLMLLREIHFEKVYPQAYRNLKRSQTPKEIEMYAEQFLLVESYLKRYSII